MSPTDDIAAVESAPTDRAVTRVRAHRGETVDVHRLGDAENEGLGARRRT